MGKIYTPAEGCCFCHNGKDYLNGDVITKDIFKPESDFDNYIKNGMIIAVPEEDNSEDEIEKLQAKADKLKAEIDEAEKAVISKDGSEDEAAKKALEKLQKRYEKTLEDIKKISEKEGE